MKHPAIIFTVVGGTVILLHIWGAATPSHENWGVHFFAFYPWGIGLVSLAISLAFLIPGVRSRSFETFESAVRWCAKMPPGVLALTLAAILIGMAVVFPARAHLLGDSSLILKLTPSNPAMADRTSNFRNQPLTHLLLRDVQMLIGNGGRADVSYLYAIVDIAAGVILLLLLFVFARSSGLSPADQGLAALILFSQAGVQFFFGYVENYALLYVMMHAFLISGWLAIERAMHPLVPGACLIAAAGLHIGALVFLPALFPVFLPYWKAHRARSLVIAAFLAAGGIALLAFAGYSPAMFGQRVAAAFHYDFLPLSTPPGGIPYGIVSWLHAVDWSNAILHATPAAVILAAVLLPMTRRMIFRRSPLAMFLMTAAGLGLLFTAVISSALGMARDWDMLASFFVPLSFLIIGLFRESSERPELRNIMFACAVLNIVHCAAWVGINADEPRHLRRAEILTVPALSGTFPRIYFEHLGATFYGRQEYGRARRWYEAYLAIDSGNPRILANLSATYQKLGKQLEAFELLKRSAELGSRNPEIYSNLATELVKLGDTLGAVRWLDTAVTLNPEFDLAHANLAIIRSNMRNDTLAAFHAIRAIDLGLRDPALYRTAGVALYRLQKFAQALPFLDAYAAMAPDDADVERMRKEIMRGR